MINKNAVSLYLKFRNKIDRKSRALSFRHRKHLVCQAGCSSCCVNLSVFAVEWEAIRQSFVKENRGVILFDSKATCGFLDKDGLCGIYKHRPLICRTHGLPVAFLNEELSGYLVDFCDKNFSLLERDSMALGARDILNLEILNQMLEHLNQLYLKDAPPGTPLRKPLSELAVSIKS